MLLPYETFEPAVAGSGTDGRSSRSVVILHGLFGQRRNWRTIAKRLAATGHTAYCLDLRNHGEAGWADPLGDGLYEAMASDVRETMRAAGVQTYALIGHSMGGKVAMITALQEPDAVERLVIVDVAPVTYPPAFEAYADAMAAADLTGVRSRREVESQLTAAVPTAGTRAFLLQNLVLDDDGAYWRPNLASIRADLPAISGWPQTAGAAPARYPGPVLVISGASSEYVDEAGRAAFARYFPSARFEVVAGAGHWVHVEAMDGFLAALAPFLAAS